MTMLRAQIFLGVSIVITAFAAFFVFSQVQLFDSATTQARVSGAGVGDSPAARATPIGANVAATITAAVGTFTPRTPTTGAGTPTAVPPALASVGRPVEFQGSRYTVNQVVDPEPPGFFSTAPGKRRVAIELTQEAVGARTAYDFTYFALRDGAGTDYTWAISNSKPEFDRGTINAGESHRGWLVFQVPLDVAPVALAVAPTGSGARTAIVDLRK